MNPDAALPWTTLEDLCTRKVSFAQNYEDILLERALPEPSGFFVDIGANDPVFHSVTKRCSDRGWSGVNVEPNPLLAAKLREARPRDLTLNCGIGDVEGTLDFFEVPSVHGWSTFVPELAAHYERQGHAVVPHKVPVTTLANVCARHVGDRAIDFLKVDVEGFERHVLIGGDWGRWRPRVVVLEATWFEAWESFLLGVDYRFACYDGINRYYVRAEDAEELVPRFESPVNILDQAVPYDLIRLFQQLQGRSALQVAATNLSRRFRHLKRRHPRTVASLKRLLRRAG